MGWFEGRLVDCEWGIWRNHRWSRRRRIGDVWHPWILRSGVKPGPLHHHHYPTLLGRYCRGGAARNTSTSLETAAKMHGGMSCDAENGRDGGFRIKDIYTKTTQVRKGWPLDYMKIQCEKTVSSEIRCNFPAVGQCLSIHDAIHSVISRLSYAEMNWLNQWEVEGEDHAVIVIENGIEHVSI